MYVNLKDPKERSHMHDIFISPLYFCLFVCVCMYVSVARKASASSQATPTGSHSGK